MSVKNRKTKEGTYKIIYESKFQTVLGKVYCLFAGHKKAHIVTDKTERSYCICCWKEME